MFSIFSSTGTRAVGTFIIIIIIIIIKTEIYEMVLSW